ncbi:uncharacterized protein LOC124468692 isoform X2 [Hypomesus transpacificus]|uniref:uncharacterized protein LOC124468692 isoform X2 n=1 Tax=Hypomesus transpacificus TaxID=137520 RepID=UPI001F071394|nr:uncharacterized protein LOC124468692 isoform X2 [Hypomesus transpacificus]
MFEVSCAVLGLFVTIGFHIADEITTSASSISPIMKGFTTPLSTTSTSPVTAAVTAAVGGAIGAVLLCLLAVIIIAHKKRAKNQKPNNDSLALTKDIVSNTTENQQTHPTNEDKDGYDDGPTYVTINHPSQNKAAPKPDTQQEDMVTYASVNLSSSRRN